MDASAGCAGAGISEGSVVKVYNARGAILAGVHLSEQILPGVVQMSTGAWYDPLDPNEKARWISTAIPTC